MDTIEEIPKVINGLIPKVIQNSDYLYKSDIKWRDDIEYMEPNEFEKNMLKDTKTPKELIESEAVEEPIVLTQEEKIKNVILMFQVIALNRMNLHPLHNVSTMNPSQKNELLGHMNCLKMDYDNDLIVDISNEFNRICNDKLFSSNTDVSTYPVYRNV
jgi:hypothetical protein